MDNHALLMNLDPQVHLQIVPRYRGGRACDGENYSDPHYGSLFGTEQRIVDGERLARLAEAIRAKLPPERP